MVAATILPSKYTILYGKIIVALVVTIQSVARRWTTISYTVFWMMQLYLSLSFIVLNSRKIHSAIESVRI